MHHRLYYRNVGGHVRVQWFTGLSARTQHGSTGDLCFRLSEWEHLKSVLEKAPYEFELVDKTNADTRKNSD